MTLAVASSRKTTVTVTLTLNDVIKALKAASMDLSVQALPNDGRGAAMTVLGGRHLSFQFEKET